MPFRLGLRSADNLSERPACASSHRPEVRRSGAMERDGVHGKAMVGLLFSSRPFAMLTRMSECPREFLVAIDEKEVNKAGHGNRQVDVLMVRVRVEVRC